MHAADYYASTRRRMVELALEIDPFAAVPACPGWTARDVVAHVVGLASDVVSGRTSGYAGPEWTEAQVRARSGDSIPDMLAEWDGLMPAFLAINRDLAGSSLPETIDHVLGPVPKSSFEAAFHVDLLHHEHDLLGARGTPRRVALDADVAAMAAQLANVRAQFAAADLPSLRLIATDADRDWRIGRDEPTVTVTASVIDYLRSFGGRRTLDEIGALAWSGDRTGMVEQMVLPFFSVPAEPIAGG
ncbi:MAG: maleylpyruvate isomerase family mycothiol-dependent enzyme [Acidimicrobiales bacterium]